MSVWRVFDRDETDLDSPDHGHVVEEGCLCLYDASHRIASLRRYKGDSSTDTLIQRRSRRWLQP